MPVLLLCSGDTDAKNLLRKAIEARYGINPPAIEQLLVKFEGRSYFKLGPIKTWVPFSSTARFIFPTHLRWDYTINPLKLPVQSGSEIFDGDQFYSTRNYKPNVAVDEEDLLQSTRRRLWSISAMLLTPLSEIYIKLTQLGEHSFQAENTVLGDSVRIFLDEDGKMISSEVNCINPDAGKHQLYKLLLSSEQQPVDGLMLPAEMKIYWDDVLTVDLKPSKADTNPNLTNKLFDPAIKI